MAKSINRVGVRASLAPRREPYWYRLETGRYVGFRRLSRATAGTWIARFYDGTDYQQKPLGDLAATPDSARFDEAKRQAEEWFGHLDRGGTTDAVTVKDACDTYVAKLRRERGDGSAKDAEGVFRRLVDDDPVARLELAKAKPMHFTAWRDRIIGRGARSSFNRNLTPVRAALNLALDDRKVSSDFAWSKAMRRLKLDKKEGRRTLYLDRQERRLLVENANDEFRPLLVAWTLLPLRPGDIAKVRVADLDVRHRMLHVPTGKTDSRDVPLTDEALAHFKECARGKTPAAWLVARAGGDKWKKNCWALEMQSAVKKADLPRVAVAYTLRHSTITDLVVGGVDIFTVAKLSGTSVRMIEEHYGHLRAEHAREALAKLSLK
jgi:integrase